VACGKHNGVDLAALRVCVSAGMIVQACSVEGDEVAETLIASAMACFDAIAALIAMS